MTSVLITGSSGFIGYNLAKTLLSKGYEVIGIDNENSDYDARIKSKRSNELKRNSNFTFIKDDISNPEIYNLIQRKEIKYFIHLAARDLYYDRPFNLNYKNYLETNVLGTANMIELAHKLKAKKFIFASTHSVYGNTKKGILTEKKIVPNPISPHGASKLAAEEVVKFMSEYYNLPAISLRIFSVYGPQMTPHMFIPNVINSLKSGKEILGYMNFEKTYRDFIYIDDVIQFILKALSKRVKYQAINIATGKSTSLQEIANKISKTMNKKLPKTKEKNLEKLVVKYVQADISKAKKILNYIPKTTLEEGLLKTLENNS